MLDGHSSFPPRNRRGQRSGGLAHQTLPLGWELPGLYRFDELWVGPAEGPEFDGYLSGSGQYAEQALWRLADRLRERLGVASG